MQNWANYMGWATNTPGFLNADGNNNGWANVDGVPGNSAFPGYTCDELLYTFNVCVTKMNAAAASPTGYAPNITGGGHSTAAQFYNFLTLIWNRMAELKCDMKNMHMPPMPVIKPTVTPPIPIGGIAGVGVITTQTSITPATSVPPPPPAPRPPAPAPAPQTAPVKTAAFTGRDFYNATGQKDRRGVLAQTYPAALAVGRQNPFGWPPHSSGEWRSANGQEMSNDGSFAPVNQNESHIFINDTTMAPVVIASVNPHGNVVGSAAAAYNHGGNLTNPVPTNQTAVANIIKHVDEFVGHVVRPQTNGVAARLSDIPQGASVSRQNDSTTRPPRMVQKHPSFLNWLFAKKN